MPRAGLHDHDFYEWFHVESGEGTHLLEGRREPLTAGDIVFIHPEHQHGFTARNPAEFTILNVALRADIVTAFLDRNAGNCMAGIWEKSTLPKQFKLSKTKAPTYSRFCNDLANGGRTSLDAEWSLAGLFRLIFSPESSEPTNELPAWLAEALIQLSSPDFALDRGVHELVRICGRSPEHVARQFRLHLKKSPTEWITEARMRRACRLLETTHLSVTEVALECGIENLSHFHRQFRKAYGTTPLKHRKSNRSVIP